MAELPAPVSGQRHEIGSPVGRLTYYSAAPEVDSRAPPLLLLHSINAAASAYEVKPLYEHYRRSRTVYALELPGFGHSDRGNRPYSVWMMTEAIRCVVRIIQEDHGRAQVDALAVSLSAEFMARAVSEMPLAFRTLALVSPTGFSRGDTTATWRNGTREMPGMLKFFQSAWVSERLFRFLTRRAVIGFFLRKTWGSSHYDRGLLDYDCLTTQQPGAQHAVYYFVSGYLFSQDILKIYQSLTLPVWMTHGVRGDFIDYSNKIAVAGRPNWTIEVFQTGAMPHFEATDRFIRGYDAFLQGAAAVAA